MSKFVATCVVMGVKARPSQDGTRTFRNAVLYFEGRAARRVGVVGHPARTGQEQRCHASGTRTPVWVGAAIKKKPDGGKLPLENRVLKRCRVPVVPRGSRQVHVGAGQKKPPSGRFFCDWCRRPDSNRHGSRHCPLKTACLPIPPRRLL